MLKKRILLILLILFLASVSATDVDVEDYNNTKIGVSISNTTNLYAYEINFDYDGLTATVQQYNFLGSSQVATYGSSIKNNILSVYGSRLDPNRTGINNSGMLFNVSYFGTFMELRYTLEIYSNGTELYTYYNNSCGDGACSSEETCTTCPQDCGECGDSGGGGGGGGGGGEKVLDLTLSPDLLKFELIEGRTTREKIRITNLKNEQIQITQIDPGELNQFIAAYLPQTPFYIQANDYVDVYIDFFARKNMLPDVYTGEIKFVTPESTISLPTLIEVKEEEPLFDVVVALEKDEYAPGDMAIATIDIQNFGDLKDIDVIVHYAIKNFAGEELVFEEGSYAIENYKLQLIGKLRVPRDAAIGDKLIFYAQASYPPQDISASASSVFTIVEPMFGPMGNFTNIFLLFLIPLAVIAIVIVTIVIIFNITKGPAEPVPKHPLEQQPPIPK